MLGMCLIKSIMALWYFVILRQQRAMEPCK